MRHSLLSASFLIATLSSASVACAQKVSLEPDAWTPTFKADAQRAGLESAYLPRLFPSSHASNLLLLRNGDLLCFWFSGVDEGQSDVGIVVSRLPKGSDTWQTPILIDHDPTKSYQNPVPFEAPDGTIWLLHTQQSAGKGQADAQILKTVSHDGGKTWNKQTVLFPKAGAYDRQPIIISDKGEWLLPIYYSTSSGITNGADTNYSAVEVSNDHGKTWQQHDVPKSEGLVQMSIVKLAPHKYVAFFRSRYADHIFRSTSTDGLAWTEPQPTDLPNNNASIQAALLKDGNIVMAFDNTSGHKPGHTLQTGARAPLSLGLSSDEGLHWQHVRDLEVHDAQFTVSDDSVRHEEYSYPSVLQMPDGKIIASYTFRRIGIKAARLDESWIVQGSTEGEYKPAAASK
ncbi:MAG TPA: sialidase family protein [Granulicella sp.]